MCDAGTTQDANQSLSVVSDSEKVGPGAEPAQEYSLVQPGDELQIEVNELQLSQVICPGSQDSES